MQFHESDLPISTVNAWKCENVKRKELISSEYVTMKETSMYISHTSVVNRISGGDKVHG